MDKKKILKIVFIVLFLSFIIAYVIEKVVIMNIIFVIKQF